MKPTTAARIVLALVYVFVVPATGSWPLDGLFFVLLFVGMLLTYYIDATYGEAP